ncbi:OmpH family outer membrane protein [Sediminitomix flava]|uniref:Periplasmic chaperone for outer membrane proteins Skp n=1 Tax=Sediminitomix flava TaxID=379075 RepID=A0A315YWE8_SEDFL|nr:OmpH family outer membrane protein [Sediminitomix flava]PWJ34100.1 periplasmic chaperone for outer membrane proteins Skp [Sediminitomix flava]
MKKFLIVTVLGLMALFSACQQQGGAVQTAQGDVQKIAIINNDSLSTYYAYAEDRFADFRKKVDKGEKQLQTRAQKLQQEFDRFQKKAQAGLMSNNDMQKKQQELLLKRDELAVAQQSQAQGLATEEVEMREEIRKRVKAYIDEYCKTQNFSVVLGVDAANATLIWSTPNTVDITEAVIEGLNKAYEEEQKTEAAEEAEAEKK